VVGWAMSEKFDGIRGFWNGKQLLTMIIHIYAKVSHN
jgi:ATP-dependent DNA ligase